MNGDDNPLHRIMKASKQKIKEIEEETVIQEIANAIGDRRIKDLSDITTNVELTDGWSTVIEYLISASRTQYSVPIGYAHPRVMVEPLKFREVVFELLGCSGLEPIPEPTEELLLGTISADSSVDAIRLLLDTVTESAENQVANGDTLFFDVYNSGHRIPTNLAIAIEMAQTQIITLVDVVRQRNSLLIEDLWYTELGRIALANLGVLGRTISSEQYELVLSVIQVSPTIKDKLQRSKKDITSNNPFDKPSLSPHYADLLDFIINHNTEGLRTLGSKHSVPTLNHLLRSAIDEYKATESSQSYRALLSSIRDHISIRMLESAIILDEMTYEKNPRIVTPAIGALGNYYHSSIVNVLINTICTTRIAKVRESALVSLKNIKYRCPETRAIVENTLSSDCKNSSALRRFYRENWKSY
ncbi:MAG: hypothetical protein P1Q69_00370 [Candidatus Thorarchaeota archaeon]|nr:hypothetical protein [Candidatus Thorarchaeota archaeon]